MEVVQARAEFISIIAFLAWSVVYQPVSETFAAHVSWQTFVGSLKPVKPGSALAVLMVNYVLQVCSAFAVWVYWNRPGTNTEMHIATLSCWIFRAFLYRL